MNTNNGTPQIGKLQRRQFNIDWKTVATALIKERGIQEGIFRVALEFGPIVGVNAALDKQAVVPAAMVPVMRMCLIEEREVGPLSVDAAQVNPRHRIVMPFVGHN